MSQGAYKDKARGMLVGLAVGDALGAPYEFGWRSRQIEELGDKICKTYTDIVEKTSRKLDWNIKISQ